MNNLSAITLAAGRGTRMKSVLPKVLHPVCGQPMLFYPIKTLKELKIKNILVIVGYMADEVKEFLAPAPEVFNRRNEKVRFVLQTPQLGTGHAVACGLKELKNFKGDIIILSGDVPLITKDTVAALLKIHKKPEKPVISFISVMLDIPKGYGRVLRDNKGKVVKIVEDKDLKGDEKKICEVNTGIYIMDSEFLKENLKKLSSRNVQNEYYLPDLINIARSHGKNVSALTHIDAEEVMGVNTRIELAVVNSVMQRKILNKLMLDGVSFIDPETSYVDYGVKIGRDSTVYPNVHISGNTVIGDGCIIEQGVKIKDSTIKEGSHIKSFSIIESSKLGRNTNIGPFARLRPGNAIGDSVRVGNFVEVKNSTIGKGTKANHLSYIGDSQIGKNVNIGAGTITCNYDGFKKYRTVIKDGVFIGSDSQLIAPVTIGKNAYIGSGSTITKDVPPEALALSRTEEKIVKGWAKRKRKK